jgi:hypothetical protein
VVGTTSVQDNCSSSSRRITERYAWCLVNKLGSDPVEIDFESCEFHLFSGCILIGDDVLVLRNVFHFIFRDGSGFRDQNKRIVFKNKLKRLKLEFSINWELFKLVDDPDVSDLLIFFDDRDSLSDGKSNVDTSTFRLENLDGDLSFGTFEWCFKNDMTLGVDEKCSFVGVDQKVTAEVTEVELFVLGASW